MLFNLLEQAAAVSENFGERAVSGGFTFLLGMIVIFAGMTILVLCVTGFGKIAEAIAKKAEKKSEKTEKPAEKPIETTDDGTVPEDIRVVIIAAIAAYYAESGSKNEFKVRKIKKL